MSARLIALLVPLALTPEAPPPSSTAIAYRVEPVLDGVDDRLLVSLRVTGLNRGMRDLAFELPLWGEWIELDEYYVRRAVGKPPVVHDLENRFFWRPQLPEQWDGTLELDYEIPIVDVKSVAHERHGLLPWRSDGYVSAYSVNTLMRLLVGDQRQDSARTLELITPEGGTAASGWGGVVADQGKQKRGVRRSAAPIAVPPDGHNTALLFSREPRRAKEARSPKEPALGLEVAQFSSGPSRVDATFELLEKLRRAYARTTGAPPPAPEHVFIVEPGMGGTHTDGAITMGAPALEDDGRFEVGTAHFVAHESFHAWLPGVLKPVNPGNGLEWFFEGFTDYFSLWHLVAIDAATPQQFADQLRLIVSIGQESPAWRSAVFADLAVDWRDPDHERVAYRGGALLAFHFDVELRCQGESRLLQLFPDLIAENGGRYDLATLETWCEANGLEESWSRYVKTPARPNVDDELVRAGWRERREGEARIITAAGAELGAFFKRER